MKISLGRVSGVAGLGKKTEVGQFKVAYEFRLRPERCGALFAAVGSMRKDNEQQYSVRCKVPEPYGGFSHGSLDLLENGWGNVPEPEDAFSTMVL